MPNGQRRAAIAAEQAEHASTVASSHDAIIGMTRFGVISSCNPAAAQLYGHVAADIIGKSAELLIPAEDRAEEAAILRRIVSGKEVERYRADRVCRDGTVVTVSVAVSPILDAAGIIVGVATVSRRASDHEGARDRFEERVDQQRTEVRVAENRFQVGMDTERAKERVEVQAAQDRFQARMDDVRARERILVQDAEERFQDGMLAEHAKERLEVQAAQDRFIEGMAAERAKERVEVQDAEDRFQVGMDAARVRERTQSRDAEDRFQVGIDAERAEAQRDNDDLQHQLQQSQRLEVLGQLAGGVAHDFNNLLAVILNYAAFAAEEVASRSDLQAVGHDIEQIQRAAESAAALTHQLLAFARREVVQPRVLDLNGIVVDVEELLRRTIGEDVVLHTNLAEDLLPVLIDGGQVEQVLVNLAVNARHAMGNGGTLTIETANHEVDLESLHAGSPLRPGRHVRLRVSDTGTGMSADIIEHVFEPFFTTKPDGMGTGLGLATAYGVVAQAGGTIEIHSQLGIGTTFTIMIPVTDEPVGPAVDAVSHERTPKGETILVVEDEDALREVTRRIFARSGYQVITAANGEEAVALAARHTGEVHLLVTDVVMPHMLGKEVAERILLIRPDIKVLYMSGYAQPVLASQGRLDPGVHLVEKPFSAASLLEMVAQILNGHFTNSTPSNAATPLLNSPSRHH